MQRQHEHLPVGLGAVAVVAIDALDHSNSSFRPVKIVPCAERARQLKNLFHRPWIERRSWVLYRDHLTVYVP